MFRKKNMQYMVLTNTHLLRFKNRSKAAEIFPEIPTSMGRASGGSHLRMSSGGSAPEIQLGADPQAYLPLRNLVAVYKLDDGRPYFTIEIASYDEKLDKPYISSLQLNDPRDSEVWLSSIRTAVTQAKRASNTTFGQDAVEYAVRCVEAEKDYDPNHFTMFAIAQRASRPGGTRSSTEDLGKLVSTLGYLVIGLHKIHSIPLPQPPRPGSGMFLSELNSRSWPIVNIIGIYAQEFDDTFHINFRAPFQSGITLHLASSSATNIALCVRGATDFLRPLWIEQPLKWHVSGVTEEDILPIPPADAEDHLCFDRTLTAYCVGYGTDPSNIRYTVDYYCEDAPEFQLLGPGKAGRSKYTSLELLAILRALRYNDTFHSISFKRAKLDNLHNVWDGYGSEHLSWSSRSGQTIAKIPKLDGSPVLVQELQCIALKNSRMRRLDFSDCLTRKAKDVHPGNRGSMLCEAIFPLNAVQLTNIDWIALNGVILSQLDIEYMYAGAVHKDSRWRGIELGRCGLDEGRMEHALEAILAHEAVLESLDLSNNPAKLNSAAFHEQLGRFQCIRRLNLSRVPLRSVSQPILPPGVLMNWKLEFLDLSGTTLNTESVDSLGTYLVSEQSNTLRELRLESCQMQGDDVAALLETMTDGRSEPRNLHLHVGGNRLEKNHRRLAKTIARSRTPTHLTMQSLEYTDEKNFRALVQAVSTNTVLEYLDISRVSIPLDASNEACDGLRTMLESNTNLKELNLSGEQAHLEAVTLGRGLCRALKGLEENTTLETLRVEFQALGLPGASTLADVLRSNNSLREVYCENNEISLQAFTTLVNAVEGNKTLLYLPVMIKDKAWYSARMSREASAALSPTSSNSPNSTRNQVRRALSSAVPSAARSASTRSLDRSSTVSSTGGGTPNVTEPDARAILSRLAQSWDKEIDRLTGYLTRNFRLYSGQEGSGLGDLSNLPSGSVSRPPTAGTLAAAVKNALMSQGQGTPTGEMERQLEGLEMEDGREEGLAEGENEGFSRRAERKRRMAELRVRNKGDDDEEEEEEEEESEGGEAVTMR